MLCHSRDDAIFIRFHIIFEKTKKKLHLRTVKYYIIQKANFMIITITKGAIFMLLQRFVNIDAVLCQIEDRYFQ